MLARLLGLKQCCWASLGGQIDYFTVFMFIRKKDVTKAAI